MSAVDDVDELIEQFDQAQGEFMKGNAEPVQKLFSHQEYVTLNNPFSPPAHGWDEVAATIERAASQFRDGEITGFEIIEKHVTPEFAYVMRVERAKAKVGGGEDVAPIALRVTMIFRNCPKSLEAAFGVALPAAKEFLLGPFWPPYASQIHAWGVA